MLLLLLPGAFLLVPWAGANTEGLSVSQDIPCELEELSDRACVSWEWDTSDLSQHGVRDPQLNCGRNLVYRSWKVNVTVTMGAHNIKEPSQQKFHVVHWVIHHNYGDSGGPLVCNGKAHSSFTYGHRSCILPKVFTRISYFEPWIHEDLRKFAFQELPDSPSSD
ncbi:LOW QUALITY PROTEIN: uncharacterized protein O3Q21_010646 [Podargus strigoides]